MMGAVWMVLPVPKMSMRMRRPTLMSQSHLHPGESHKRNSGNGFGMNFHINPDETLVLDILLGITNGNEAEALKLKLMWGGK